MRVFMLPPDYNGEQTIKLTGKDFHYLVNVLRLKEGSAVTTRDKHGIFFELTISLIAQNYLIANAEKKGRLVFKYYRHPQCIQRILS